MASDPDRFSSKTKATLALRAAQQCSNPGCYQVTSGPHSNDAAAISLGEAAHIHGAKLGSARYLIEMTSAERSSITNGIWLCRKCARLIDADEGRFPAELLFRWKCDHEGSLGEAMENSQVAQPGMPASTELASFDGFSSRIKQIVFDKPENWQFLLAIALVRCKSETSFTRLQAVKRGLYFKRGESIIVEDLPLWTHHRLQELAAFAAMLDQLLSVDFNDALDRSKSRDDASHLIAPCRNIAELIEHLADWEESVQATRGPFGFSEMKAELLGMTTPISEALIDVLDRLEKMVLEHDGTPGHHNIIGRVAEPPPGLKRALTCMERIVLSKDFPTT